MRLPLAVACLAALVLAASGCGGDKTSAVDIEPIPKVTVVMEDGEYRPAKVRIEPGTRVTWVNAGKDPHTAQTEGAGFFEVNRRKLDEYALFDIHTLQPGEAESIVIERPGIYEYDSSLDAKMTGAVEVVDSDG